jgi:hypothetical protein
MSTAVYYINPKTPVEEEGMRNRARTSRNTTAQYRRPDDPKYDPHWLSNPDGNERRSRWIGRLREFGFVD